MEDNQAVTALDILLNIFDNFQNDLFVVDVTIVLSLNLQRNILQTNRSENYQIYLIIYLMPLLPDYLPSKS